VNGTRRSLLCALLLLALMMPTVAVDALSSQAMGAYVPPEGQKWEGRFKRSGVADNANLAYLADGQVNASVNVAVAILDIGVDDHVDLNVVERTDCRQPDHLENPFFVPPSYSNPDWRPNLRLNALEVEDPLLNPDSETTYEYGCLDGTGYDGSPEDGKGHATALMGVMGEADNDRGGVGFSPGADLYSVRTPSGAFNSEDENIQTLRVSQVIAGLDWVRDRRLEFEDGSGDGDAGAEISVVELALGCKVSECGRSDLLREALDDVIAAGVVVVAAAGNSNADAQEALPAGHPDVVTVSLVTDTDGQPGGLAGPYTCDENPNIEGSYQVYDDRRAAGSGWGTVVDIASHGAVTAGGCSGGGTSTASARVAGAASVLTSRCTPHSRLGALAIANALSAEGSYDWEDIEAVEANGEITGWGTESPDGWHEPLLDVSDPIVFDPKMVGEGGSDNCAWLERQPGSDVDGDRRSDLVALEASGDVRVRRGMMEGSSEYAQGFDMASAWVTDDALDPALLDGKGDYVIDVADVTGDGRADLITAGSNKEGASVHPGKSDRTFGPGILSLKGSGVLFNGSGTGEPIAVADVTGDGLGDFVSNAGSSLVVAPGRSDGTFGWVGEGMTVSVLAADSALLDGVGSYFLDATDVNGDTHADVVAVSTVAAGGQTTPVLVYLGKASGEFAAATPLPGFNPIFDDGAGGEPVGLGDVNGDGRSDLVVRTGFKTPQVRFGKEDGTFEIQSTQAYGELDSALMDGTGLELIGLLDHNRDGMADLTALNQEGDVLTYNAYKSGSNYLFAAPTTNAGALSSIAQSGSGSELASEKPIIRRAGCAPSGCAWP